jgi:hypothetical protein
MSSTQDAHHTLPVRVDRVLKGALYLLALRPSTHRIQPSIQANGSSHLDDGPT